jgi:hypothetical protein
MLPTSDVNLQWLSSQLVRRVPTTCPTCRARVDASNLKAVQVSSLWSEEDEDFYDDSDEDSPNEDSDNCDFDEEEYDGEEDERNEEVDEGLTHINESLSNH